jgi:hypothetical protein
MDLALKQKLSIRAMDLVLELKLSIRDSNTHI